MEKTHGYGTWEVICSNCGTPRLVRSHKYKNGNIRAVQNCCHPCRALKLQKRVSLECPSCGRIRVAKPAESKQRITNLCKTCVRKTNKRKQSVRGLTNTTSRGYVVVLGMTGHPLTKINSVLEHWLVMYNNHPMGPKSVIWFKEKKFTIHHKNGIRDDNRFNNLELRAPGNHPAGWSIEDMKEVIRKHDNILVC